MPAHWPFWLCAYVRNTSTLLLLPDLARLKQIMQISALHFPKFSANILKEKKKGLLLQER